MSTQDCSTSDLWAFQSMHNQPAARQGLGAIPTRGHLFPKQQSPTPHCPDAQGR